MSPLNNKHPALLAGIEKVFPQEMANVKAGKCPFCAEVIGEFRDPLSRKEFQISGLCQKCQDETFGSGGEDDECDEGCGF
jgi:hypothetical protein